MSKIKLQCQLNSNFFIKVWVYLLMLLILSLFILKKSSENQLSMKQIIELMLILFLNQSSDKISRWKTYLKPDLKHYKFKLALLLIIWIICSLILTKSFTGLLLKTYYKEEFVPLINNLDEINEYPELLIAGRLKTIRKFENSLEKYPGFNINTTIKRILRYQFRNKKLFIKEVDTFSPKIIEDMIMLKSVILADSESVESIFDIYRQYENQFIRCTQAYLSGMGFFLVRKNEYYSKLIKFM